ncbi:MAG: hypothetical protein P4M05_10925 [Bradyrhizobium sp.]|nr:hypothetical protein [Bradyrhizobium sp.]
MAKARTEVQHARDDAKRWLADHVMREEPVRSFRFHSVHLRPSVENRWEGCYPFAKLKHVVEKASFGYDSHYAFTLTWTPGHLALVGDLGTLTLIHYHALRRFEDIGWALSSDHHYLMSKTDVREVYDAEETFTDLIRQLNAPVLEALNGYRGLGRSIPGMRQELQAYRREKRQSAQLYAEALRLAESNGTAPPDADEFDVGEPPYTSDLGWERPLTRFSARWRIPEEWEAWVKVWRELVSLDDLDFVRLAKNRRSLHSAIKDELKTAESAARFFGRLGFDDQYGTYCWPRQTYFQIAAIQHGVRMILTAAGFKASATPSEAAA